MKILYTLIARDALEKEYARAMHRAGHLAYFARIADQIAIAGPMLDEHGKSIGSLVIVESDSADAAVELLRKDPFFAAGVWASIDVITFKAASGKMISQS